MNEKKIIIFDESHKMFSELTEEQKEDWKRLYDLSKRKGYKPNIVHWKPNLKE